MGRCERDTAVPWRKPSSRRFFLDEPAPPHSISAASLDRLIGHREDGRRNGGAECLGDLGTARAADRLPAKPCRHRSRSRFPSRNGCPRRTARTFVPTDERQSLLTEAYLARNREFESSSLQRGVRCEPAFGNLRPEPTDYREADKRPRQRRERRDQVRQFLGRRDQAKDHNGDDERNERPEQKEQAMRAFRCPHPTLQTVKARPEGFPLFRKGSRRHDSAIIQPIPAEQDST
jgi:hypothetical protein